MREILFRGKLAKSGKWSEGNLVVNKRRICIITPDETPLGTYGQVIPETIGQYTGLVDKNGKKIFEGDIVRWIIQYEREEGLHRVEGVDKVIYDAPLFELKEEAGFTLAFDNNEAFVLEIIGNIHDTPELLRGEQND